MDVLSFQGLLYFYLKEDIAVFIPHMESSASTFIYSTLFNHIHAVHIYLNFVCFKFVQSQI